MFSKGVVCRTNATSPPPSTKQWNAPRNPAKSSSVGSAEHRPAPAKTIVFEGDNKDTINTIFIPKAGFPTHMLHNDSGLSLKMSLTKSLAPGTQDCWKN